MNSDLKVDDILFKVKEQLNRDKIQLWLPPYHNDSNGMESEQALLVLCEQIMEQLNINQDQCLSALRDLQSRALEHLQSNATFKQTGVASLRVKVSGDTPKMFTVDIPLTSTTAQLVQELSGRVGVEEARIKLISHGRVLKPTETLGCQGVKHRMLLMAVILAQDNKLLDSEKRFQALENTKNDVHLLAGSSNANNEYYFQVENQSGETLNIPYQERKALVSAMALHEKGRAALKREDYSLALVFFLEADKEYSECTSHLLNTCDNYALLHLDIAWCYLCLRNPAQIPDADNRLSLCEQNFHKSYGPNLERLMAIKGSTGNESALFMRLHLLQGVVMFHNNRRVEARQLLERARGELAGLKVDDNSLCLLLELGFTSSEARIGLRSTHGNVEAAEELIHRKREEKELTRKRNRAKLKTERERISLGMCADGKQWCEPALVEQLVGMGFDRIQSVEALKLANNIISEAVTLIQEQPHLLPVTSQSIAQLASMGFNPEMARHALEKFKDLEKAVKSLTDVATSQGADAAASASAASFKRNAKLQEEQAFERVSEGLIDSDLTEDHLDLDLAQEEQFLMQYLSLLD